MSRSVKSNLAIVEAFVSGIFGTVLCVLIALIPLLMLDRIAAFLPAGDESVIVLLLVCMAIEGRNVWRIWAAFLDPNFPPGPSAALKYEPSASRITRMCFAVWYLFHTCNAMAFIGMCKYKAIHGTTTLDKVTGLLLGFAMFGAFNIFLALTAKTCTKSNAFVTSLWKCRFLIDVMFEAMVLTIGFQ